MTSCISNVKTFKTISAFVTLVDSLWDLKISWRSLAARFCISSSDDMFISVLQNHCVVRKYNRKLTHVNSHWIVCLKLSLGHHQPHYHVCAVADPIWHQELWKGLLSLGGSHYCLLFSQAQCCASVPKYWTVLDIKLCKIEMDNGKFAFRNSLAKQNVKHCLFSSLISFLAMKKPSCQTDEWTVICTRPTL